MVTLASHSPNGCSLGETVMTQPPRTLLPILVRYGLPFTRNDALCRWKEKKKSSNPTVCMLVIKRFSSPMQPLHLLCHLSSFGLLLLFLRLIFYFSYHLILTPTSPDFIGWRIHCVCRGNAAQGLVAPLHTQNL